MTRQTTPFTTVTANLGRLNRRQLEEVAAMVAGLLDVVDEEDAEATPLTSTKVGPAKSGQTGYIEHKTINGCGPYAYLRFWAGKTHKSTSLGKVETKQ